MKKYIFKISKYMGEDGYQKPFIIAQYHMECIDDDVAYDLAEEAGKQLPFNGFVSAEEVKKGGDLP